MTPGARVAAAIDLLAAIDAGKAPADDLLGEYFRRHRFAGVKDRAAISAHVYGILRRRAALDWWIGRAGEGATPDARRRMLAALVLLEDWSPGAVAQACDGDRFRPAPLDAAERRMVAALAGCNLLDPAMPDAARGDYPDWLEPHLRAALGRDLAREMAAMQEEAPLDLRANALKGDREAARATLAREGVEAARTRFSPVGLRLYQRAPLGGLDAFRRGLVE